MKLRKPVCSASAALILGVGAALAQKNVIDNNAIYNALQKNVPAMAAQNRQYSVSALIRNVSKTCPAELPEKLGRVKQSKERLRPEEVYSRCIDAVLLFGNYYDCGECSNMHVGVGASATALTPDGVCITNYHVVEDIIRNNQKELKGDSLFFVATRDGQAYAVTAILGYSEGADIAFIKVDTRGDKLACLPLGEPLEAGVEVSIISNPKQLFYIYGHGVVARNTIYNSRNSNTRRMEITPDYAEGSSGAPIIDCYGNVAGMVASTVGLYFDQEHKRDLQMVVKSTIPVSVIKSVAGEGGIKK